MFRKSVKEDLKRHAILHDSSNSVNRDFVRLCLTFGTVESKTSYARLTIFFILQIPE